MNIGFPVNRQKRVITLYTWIWLTGSVVCSIYFAFWLFPEINSGRSTATVQLYFQAKESSDNSTIYYPNLETYREGFRKNLSDKNFLYFSACDVLPVSQRPICDSTRNWKGIRPSELNCKDVSTCSVSNYTLSENQRDKYLNGLIPTGGANYSIPDLPPLSWSDPSGWGNAAKLPLFFITLFLALKLGRTLGEFLFLAYNK